jgi:hypothetical protein
MSEKTLGADAAAVVTAEPVARDAASHVAPTHTVGAWRSYAANVSALWLLRRIRDSEPEAWSRILKLQTIENKGAADVWDELKAAIAKAEGRER